MNIFLAHINDIPAGVKKPLPQLNNLHTLANNDGQYFLVNNICPHQRSRILTSEQSEFKCQYHNWSWNNDGTPKDAGTTKACNNSKLILKPVFETNGLLFKDTIEDTSVFNKIDFRKMVKVSEQVDRVNADYKHIMDVFLDVDHVPVLHPGVYDKIGVEGVPKVEWNYYDWGNIQEVKLEDATVRAVWIAVYPYTMIEWQPGAVFVTVCRPVGEATDVSIITYQDPNCDPALQKLNADIFDEAWQQDSHQAESIVEFMFEGPHIDISKQHFRTWLKNGTDT
jgi:phenylpropionate dioxygenase-like ring-hydroxylating dioxygenase large terminal subunit